MSTRKEVKTSNVKYLLLDMRSLVYRAIATHSVTALIMSAMWILEADLAGVLLSYLLLLIGARVMITKNLWVQAGIVNGLIGTIRGIVMGEWPWELPACVLVELDHYLGPNFLPTHLYIVPLALYKSAFEHCGQSCSQIQFPIVLPWALVHGGLFRQWVPRPAGYYELSK